MAVLNYWWVTRPKRKLNSIPEVLAAFSNVALSAQWSGSRNVHIEFEEELERDGLKRVGKDEITLVLVAELIRLGYQVWA